MTAIPLPPVAGLAEPTAAIDVLVDELVLRSLEPAIAAFDSLLGGGTQRTALGGDPDGYDGLSRDGEIDRLLPSDWLLIGEEPDEFIRRFEWRELSYLHRRTIAPRAAPTSLVLFDTGPMQVGRPRVAQLALLLALTRRASAAGVPLRWGTLQSDRREHLYGPPSLLRFVRSRTNEPPDLAPIDALVDDALVVSPSRVASSHRLVLHEDGDALVATLIDQLRSASRSLRIPLPDDQLAIRALRDPGARSPEPTQTSGEDRAASNLVFDAAGNKLLARSPDGHTVLVIPAPNSVNAPPSRVRRHQTLASLPPVTAAGRIGRGSVSVTVRPGSVYVQCRGVRRDWLPQGTVPLQGALPADFDADAADLGILWATDRQLYAVAGDFLVAGATDGFRVLADRDARAKRFNRAGQAVVRPTASGWVLLHGPREEPAAVRSDDVILGAANHPQFGPAALVLSGDRRSIELVGWDDRRHFVARSPYEAVDGIGHHVRSLVAVRTVTGGVVLWDWMDGRRLFEWMPV